MVRVAPKECITIIAAALQLLAENIYWAISKTFNK